METQISKATTVNIVGRSLNAGNHSGKTRCTQCRRSVTAAAPWNTTRIDTYNVWSLYARTSRRVSSAALK